MKALKTRKAIILRIFQKIPFFSTTSSGRIGDPKSCPGTATGEPRNLPKAFSFSTRGTAPMKKTRRTILFLESLENRVVPSNTQALLHADHVAAEAASLTAVME